MARVKNSFVTKKRHKKVLKEASGYFGSKHRLYKSAKEQLMHAGVYAFRDRKQKKREFRKLWIIRINAGCRENDISYSKFINGLTKAGIEINRKMLSEIAINDKAAFTNLVEIAKNGLVNVKEEIKEVKKEIKKEIKEETKKEVTNLSKLTIAQLKELAKNKNIAGYTSMKKAELIEVLEK